MSPVKIFLITNKTLPRRNLEVSISSFYFFHDDSLSLWASSPSINFPYFPFLLLFPIGKACLSDALTFFLICLVLLRLLESDCPNYCNKALSQDQFSINVWGHNRHEQVLDPWVLSSVYLIPFVLWNDTPVGLLHTPYTNGPKSVPLNGLIFELCTMLPIIFSFHNHFY